MESIIWFLVIGVLFYLMMRYGCGAHIGGHGGHGEDHPKHMGRPDGSMDKVRDPVCGMEIDRDQAFSMTRGAGRQIYFCSENCHNKFNEKPEKYF